MNKYSFRSQPVVLTHGKKSFEFCLLLLLESLEPLMTAQLEFCAFVCFSKRNAAWPFTSRTDLRRRAAATVGWESRSPSAGPAPPILCLWASFRKSTMNRPHQTAAPRAMGTPTQSPVSTDRCFFTSTFSKLKRRRRRYNCRGHQVTLTGKLLRNVLLFYFDQSFKPLSA